MSSAPAAFSALREAGNQPGLKVWRVNKFNLEAVPKQDIGSFFQGDCYLVLDTFLAEGVPRHHVHFWLGKDATQDEAGSVAIFASQLDEALGGGPVQFRQPQGSESPEFLKLFPRLRYMAGGYATGFRDAASAARAGPARLYQVKSPNKTCVQVFEVPCALSSLNHGDCFMLENPASRSLWVWHGEKANMREKMRVVEAANAFKEGTGTKMCVIDDGDTVSSEALAFFSCLGCAQPPAHDDIKDADTDRPPPAVMAPPMLYKASGGGTSFTPLSSEGQLIQQSLLDPAGQFVLHAGGCVWVWTGLEAAKDAGPPLQVGARFAAAQGLPANALVKAVKPRFEPGLFTTYFAGWRSAEAGGDEGGLPTRDSFGVLIPGKGKGTDEYPYNPEEAAQAMAAQAREALEAAAKAEAGAANGKGALEAAAGRYTSSRVQVWALCSATSWLELPKQEIGHFYDGSSYVVLHTYSTSTDASDARYAVYTWQGRHCGAIESGAAALMAADLHKAKYAGRSTLVRLEPNTEPEHFVRLFKGALIVRRGARPANVAPGRSPPGTHLYQVKGDAVAVAHAVEVDAKAASLCSGDCFVLEVVAPVGEAAGGGAATAATLWVGGGASGTERDVARTVAATLAAGGEVTEVKEGEEPDSFWAALGGKAAYASSSSRRHVSGPALLLHLRDAAGRGLKVDVYSVFSQEHLVGDDVLLLDTGAEMYVWYGRTCKPHERPRARDVAGRYLAATGRALAPGALVEVEAGQEPPFFTCHFRGWDAGPVATIADPYEEKLKAMALKEQEKDKAAEGQGA